MTGAAGEIYCTIRSVAAPILMGELELKAHVVTRGRRDECTYD